MVKYCILTSLCDIKLQKLLFKNALKKFSFSNVYELVYIRSFYICTLYEIIHGKMIFMLICLKNHYQKIALRRSIFI